LVIVDETHALRLATLGGLALARAAAVAWALPMTLALAAAPLIEESISPAQIAVGESAQLTIKSAGTDLAPPPLPVVAGLEFRVIERLHGSELVHGASLATTTTLVRVTPQLAGTFIIPEVSPRAPPLTLRVTPADVGLGSPATQHAVAGTALPSGVRLTQDGSAFIRLTLARREVYVGESVPVAIEVGMRAGVVTSLNGLPTLGGSDFTLNNLSRQPERTERAVDGKPFVVLTWHSVLAPVKAGVFSLIVEAPLTIRVSTRPRQEVLLEDQLGDPFMQRIFGATVRKDLKAASPPLELSVAALPAEARPPEFSGAVGSFKISSELSSATAVAGDPLTLRLHVVGSGNFDRVDSSMLAHVEGWKTYPPTASFKSTDAVGFQGEKIFEQPVIAATSGARKLPALTFSYFDPASRRYETARSPPISVTIFASAADSKPDARPPSAGARGMRAAVLELRPDHAASPRLAGSLVPLYLQPRFLAIPSMLSLLGAVAWVRGRSGARPARGVRRRALAQLEAAARAGESKRFFTLAGHTLREALAARWRLTPDDITAGEVHARLGSEGDRIRELLILADEANYAGRGVSTADLAQWLDVVRPHARREKSA
jgi:hypothetical protein